MGHDWIFEVLEDLRAYAVLNDLPATAAKAEEALLIARAEVAGGDDRPGDRGQPKVKRAN